MGNHVKAVLDKTALPRETVLKMSKYMKEHLGATKANYDLDTKILSITLPTMPDANNDIASLGVINSESKNQTPDSPSAAALTFTVTVDRALLEKLMAHHQDEALKIFLKSKESRGQTVSKEDLKENDWKAFEKDAQDCFGLFAARENTK